MRVTGSPYAKTGNFEKGRKWQKRAKNWWFQKSTASVQKTSKIYELLYEKFGRIRTQENYVLTEPRVKMVLQFVSNVLRSWQKFMPIILLLAGKLMVDILHACGARPHSFKRCAISATVSKRIARDEM